MTPVSKASDHEVAKQAGTWTPGNRATGAKAQEAAITRTGRCARSTVGRSLPPIDSPKIAQTRSRHGDASMIERMLKWRACGGLAVLLLALGGIASAWAGEKPQASATSRQLEEMRALDE
ncbi:MAG: hypothetical protein ACRED4_00030 [Brevundimonas sp.]